MGISVARTYKMKPGDFEIFKKAADPGNGVGVNWFTSYYFGRELREWQWHFHHASQQQISIVGGTGKL